MEPAAAGCEALLLPQVAPHSLGDEDGVSIVRTAFTKLADQTQQLAVTERGAALRLLLVAAQVGWSVQGPKSLYA